MIKPQNTKIVLQCPNCGARAGLKSGRTHCSQDGHPPMVPAWFATGKLLTEKERQEQNLMNGGAREEEAGK